MLSKEGFYAIDTNDEAVTEERLNQNDEFDLVSMMSILQDSLQQVYVMSLRRKIIMKKLANAHH